MLAESEICVRPRFSMISSTGAFAAPDGFEDFLRDLARDRAGRDLVEQRRERRRGHPRRAHFQAVAVQRARELAHDPVRGDLRPALVAFATASK
jgi:hypothetical protein